MRRRRRGGPLLGEEDVLDSCRMRGGCGGGRGCWAGRGRGAHNLHGRTTLIFTTVVHKEASRWAMMEALEVAASVCMSHSFQV